MTLHRIVVASKDKQIEQLIQKACQQIFIADDPSEALDITQTVEPDLIVFDECFGASLFCEFIDIIKNNSIDTPVVITGGSNNESDSSNEFLQMGAFDYLNGKQDEQHLKQIVSRIKNMSITQSCPNMTIDFFANDSAASVSMVGKSKATLKTLNMINLVANSQCNPVLIIGETGTGKEMAAKAIHTIRHFNQPFVAVNCAALTANLLESELFGHVKGSFTGAHSDKIGLFELAGNGSIFLDEISEMPLDLQAKLLRVLQEKTFRKVGGVKNISCNATIIVSSNRNLKKEVEQKTFRSDLYYRLNTCPIFIAPLRSPERRQDIALLAKYFIQTSTICPEKNGKIKSLTKLAFEALDKHNWHGNVRELKNIIDRAILLETTDKIGLSSIIFDPTEFSDASQNPTPDKINSFSLEKAEKELVARALQETGWQKTRAATLLGITRATLYAKVKQHNIEKGSYIAKEAQSDPLEHASTEHLVAVN